MKIYVVTTGSYSDYSINSMFSTRELAEQYTKGIYEANDVEEYELDEFKEQMRDGFCWWLVIMLKDGSVYRSEPSGWEKPSYVKDGESIHVGFIDYSFLGFHMVTGVVLEVYCKSDTKERAIKITNEIRTRLIAMNEWKEK